MAGNGFAIISKAAMALSLVLAGAVVGQAAAAAEPKAGSAKKDPSKRVCRSIMPTGSRFTKRLRLSQEEWDRSEKAAQDGLFENQLDGAARPVPGGPNMSS